jgi:hypothetical protein
VKHELPDLLAQPEGPSRTAALAAWVQSLYRQHPPVLVGGGAVELYSGGAYVTGDLDFAGEVPSEVASRLREAGFARQGRHWVHEAGQVFLEFPSSALEPDERAERLTVGEVTVLVLGLEEVVVDRLAAWKHWRSEIDGINALQVWRAREPELDRARLERLARKRHVADSLTSLSAFAARLAGRAPTAGELEAWARGR